jgi:hypothetical protein
MFSPGWAKAVAGIEVFTIDSHWRAEESVATPWLHTIRDRIPEDLCWVLRNGVFWDGESIAVGDVFRVFGSSLKMPDEATPLENLNQMVWWREELARIADQIPVTQARMLLRSRIAELKAGKIRILRNGKPWKKSQ